MGYGGLNSNNIKSKIHLSIITMKLIYTFLLIGMVLFFSSCAEKKPSSDPLSSWNDTPMKSKIISFVQNEVPKIPVEDRIATFDLDGTLACEKPLWFEMYCAVQGLCIQVQKDSSLLGQSIYRYAEKLSKNPADTSVTNHWGNLIDSMVYNAFKGWDNEEYIDFSDKYLSLDTNHDYDIILNKTFYRPMLELIQYLHQNKFQIYVVSGSLEGLLWSVCPGELGLDRNHLIGTAQSMSPNYFAGKKTSFILQPQIYKPKDNRDGKALNIYNHIGKIPVFAFGNTTGDFGMFKYTSTNTLPHACFLLNHDDPTREYAYLPYYDNEMPDWIDTMRVNGWNIVNMKENFSVVFEGNNPK